MRFWLIAGVMYAGLLAGVLALPVAAIWTGREMDTLSVALYVLAVVAVILATFVACLMAARALFPGYWWMGQVLGQDVFEFEGVYFVGMRLSRMPTRLQRILFGADERFRWWDMIFGLLFLVFLVPHGLAAATIYRHAAMEMPRRILLPETLHTTTLSALPLMEEWHVAWSSDAVMTARLEQEAAALNGKPDMANADWFRLAQVDLLLAFHPRSSVLDPYDFSPSDRVYFNRGQGARATTIARKLLSAPEPFRTDAWVLMGFFNLSDGNYRKALPPLQSALKAMDRGAASDFPRPLVTLLLAHCDALAGETAQARHLLEAQAVDDTVSPHLMALTLEHLADVLRLQGHYAAAQTFLDKALAAYRKQKDTDGMARIYIQRGALYLDQGQTTAASQEISRASSQVIDRDDLFTRNMVERISHLLPATG